MEANFVDTLADADLPSALDAVPEAQREIHDGDMLVVKIERAYGEMLHVSLTSGSQTFTGILFSNVNGYVPRRQPSTSEGGTVDSSAIELRDSYAQLTNGTSISSGGVSPLAANRDEQHVTVDIPKLEPTDAESTGASRGLRNRADSRTCGGRSPNSSAMCHKCGSQLAVWPDGPTCVERERDIATSVALGSGNIVKRARTGAARSASRSGHSSTHMPSPKTVVSGRNVTLIKVAESGSSSSQSAAVSSSDAQVIQVAPTIIPKLTIVTERSQRKVANGTSRHSPTSRHRVSKLGDHLDSIFNSVVSSQKSSPVKWASNNGEQRRSHLHPGHRVVVSPHSTAPTVTTDNSDRETSTHSSRDNTHTVTGDVQVRPLTYMHAKPHACATERVMSSEAVQESAHESTVSLAVLPETEETGVRLLHSNSSELSARSRRRKQEHPQASIDSDQQAAAAFDKGTRPARKSQAKRAKLAHSVAEANTDGLNPDIPTTNVSSEYVEPSREAPLDGLVPVHKPAAPSANANASSTASKNANARKGKRGRRNVPPSTVAGDDNELLDMNVFKDYVRWKLAHPDRTLSDTVSDSKSTGEAARGTSDAPAEQPTASRRSSNVATTTDNSSPGKLNLKIKSRTVTQCTRRDGSLLKIDDVVWGKLSGWPWWPGRVLSIVEVECSQAASVEQTGTIQKTVAIEWFGDRTISEYPCDELRDFVNEYTKRFDRKALTRYSGRYRLAIREAQSHAYKIMQEEMRTSDDSSSVTTEKPVAAPSVTPIPAPAPPRPPVHSAKEDVKVESAQLKPIIITTSGDKKAKLLVKMRERSKPLASTSSPELNSHLPSESCQRSNGASQSSDQKPVTPSTSSDAERGRKEVKVDLKVSPVLIPLERISSSKNKLPEPCPDGISTTQQFDEAASSCLTSPNPRGVLVTTVSRSSSRVTDLPVGTQLISVKTRPPMASPQATSVSTLVTRTDDSDSESDDNRLLVIDDALDEPVNANSSEPAENVEEPKHAPCNQDDFHVDAGDELVSSLRSTSDEPRKLVWHSSMDSASTGQPTVETHYSSHLVGEADQSISDGETEQLGRESNGALHDGFDLASPNGTPASDKRETFIGNNNLVDRPACEHDPSLKQTQAVVNGSDTA